MNSLVSRLLTLGVLLVSACGYDSRPFYASGLEGVPTLSVDCLVGPCTITVKGEDGLVRGYLQEDTNLVPLKDYKFEDYLEFEAREGDAIDLVVPKAAEKGTIMAQLWVYEGFFLRCVTADLSMTHPGGVQVMAGEVPTSSYMILRRPKNPFKYE